MTSLIIRILPLFISTILSLIILHRSQMQSTLHRGTEDITVNIGGMAIFPILMMALCLTLGISRWLDYYDIMQINLGISGDRILQVISGCALLYIIGLKTDFHGTFAQTKFLTLLAATAMFPLSGLWIRDLQGVCDTYTLSPWIGLPLTILISMLLTESVAMLDDQRGTGILLSALMLLIYFVLSILVGFTLGILITSAALGLLIVYSLMKWLLPTWSDVRMGYSGAYVIGYLLSYATLSLIHPAGIDMPHATGLLILLTTAIPLIALWFTRDERRDERRVSAVIRMHIDRRERIMTEQADHRAWDANYGRRVWEADTPVETIRHKHQKYGTLGVAPQFIMGEEIDFIPDGMSAMERHIKRLLDLSISIVLLIVFSPIFLICALLIKMEDGGSVIYSQERIGRFGRPFLIYKFRSMRPDAEAEGPALSTPNKADDPRLTRVGRYLRAHHLDELPQLWNVLCGDMSFIGYRPERKYYIDQIMQHDPRYPMLYQIRPGVTSYATLYNGYTDTMEKMLRRLTYDLYYLEHRSFRFDMKVLWDTFIAIVFGRKF